MIAGTVTTEADGVVVGDNNGTQKQKLQKKAEKKKKTTFGTQPINKFFMDAVIDPGTVDKNRVDNNKIPSDDGPPRKQEEL